MIQKINFTASEHGLDKIRTIGQVDKMINDFLRLKIVGIIKGLIIPDKLISETERFMDRNMIENGNFECCPRCLKAFVLNKSLEIGLTVQEREYLNRIFPGEAGHNDYYMDEDRIYKIWKLNKKDLYNN